MNKFVLPAVVVIIVLGAIGVYAAKTAQTNKDSAAADQAMMHESPSPSATATADAMMHDTMSPSPTATPDAMMSH